MKSLAETILEELNSKGANLGNVSIFLIQKVLDIGLEELQDKLHRRNMQIKELKKKLQMLNAKITTDNLLFPREVFVSTELKQYKEDYERLCQFIASKGKNLWEESKQFNR